MELGDFASTPLLKGEGPALGEREQEVERQSPEWLAGDGQKFPMDGGDGPTAVEGDGEKGDLSSVSVKKKKNDSLTKASLSAALVLMLAVTGWLLYRKVLAPAPPAKPPLPAVITEVDKQIELYSRKLDEAGDGLDEAWAMASKEVKRAFTTHYMPSGEREHVAEGQALSYYKMHVVDMLEQPQPADDKEKKECLYKLQMLTSILEAAKRRLDALRTLGVNEELPALILGRESGKRDEHFYLGGIDLKAFLYNLGERGIPYEPMDDLPTGKQTVPPLKVLELVDLLSMEEKMDTLDRDVHHAFEHFLRGQGLSLETLQAEDAKKIAVIKLPRDPNAMDTQLFVRFLHSRHHSVEAAKYRREILDYLCGSWSEESVVKATEQLREHHKKDLEDLLRQKREMLSQARQREPVPLTHGYPLAVFLV